MLLAFSIPDIIRFFQRTKIGISRTFRPHSKKKCIFPPEIIRQIASHSDELTLYRLLQCSISLYNLSTSLLYRNLVITQQNAEKVFRGLANTAREGRVIRVIQGKAPRSLLWMWMDFFCNICKIKFATPLTLTYPYVMVEEEDDLDDEITYPQLGSPTDGYPSVQSHQRKIKLLSYTRTLTIASIPRRIISQDFKAWGLISSVSPVEDRLFPNVEKIVVRGQAIWELAEWTDKYQRPPTDRHPFIDGLLNTSNPQAICVTYPRITPDQLMKFVNDRIGHLREMYSQDEWSRKIESLKASFRQMTHEVDQATESFLHAPTSRGSQWSPSEITVHDRRAGNLTFGSHISTDDRHRHTRFFLEDCKIDHHRSSDPVTLCPQHTHDTERRFQLGRAILEDCRMTKFKKWEDESFSDEDRWELILPHAVTEEDEDEVLRKWEGWRDEIISELPDFRKDKLKIIILSEAEVCNCCGHTEGS